MVREIYQTKHVFHQVSTSKKLIVTLNIYMKRNKEFSFHTVSSHSQLCQVVLYFYRDYIQQIQDYRDVLRVY